VSGVLGDTIGERLKVEKKNGEQHENQSAVEELLIELRPFTG
jgi:hypothetical protein